MENNDVLHWISYYIQEHLELQCVGWLSLERGTPRKNEGNLGRRGPSLLSVSSSSSSTKILHQNTAEFPGFLLPERELGFFVFLRFFFYPCGIRYPDTVMSCNRFKFETSLKKD